MLAEGLLLRPGAFWFAKARDKLKESNPASYRQLDGEVFEQLVGSPRKLRFQNQRLEQNGSANCPILFCKPKVLNPVERTWQAHEKVEGSKSMAQPELKY